MCDEKKKYKAGDTLPTGYVLGLGRQSINLTETDIRYAMANSRSNLGAANFLNISRGTYKKYATQYIDSETGKTLYDLHKNQSGSGVKKTLVLPRKSKYSLSDILDGKFPEYKVHRLKKRLAYANLDEFPYSCHKCGFDEKRITDGKIPLILDHIDNDFTNHHRDNMQFLCYNCFYLLKGNIIGRQPEWTSYSVNISKEQYRKAMEEYEKNMEKINEKGG